MTTKAPQTQYTVEKCLDRVSRAKRRLFVDGDDHHKNAKKFDFRDIRTWIDAKDEAKSNVSMNVKTSNRPAAEKPEHLPSLNKSATRGIWNPWTSTTENN
ncbi:hypothetical protein Bhyg_09151 [Pseudolycoriella hygida]|uniref:Uncharacterized protein n=1 Tax=Pseudolycoriella hygida TaxID=35572 RepID=A0A9Q0N7S6_9DIPT|nr:hypothetical protein Bhyg_09151 [Pseudolycoriella hygida]